MQSRGIIRTKETSVATHKSAIKRIKISRQERTRNRQWKSRLRTVMKAVRSAETPESAAKAYKEAQPIIDRTARRGIIHKNAAARYKSELDAHIKRLAGAASGNTGS